MKTVRQWLEQIEEPYRTKALTNMHKCNGNHVADLQQSTISDALMCAFSWENSNEGFIYWNNLIKYNKL